MQHFVNNVERYLVNQIIHISWQEFQNDLQNNVSKDSSSHFGFLLSFIFLQLDAKARLAFFLYYISLLVTVVNLWLPFLFQVHNIDDLHKYHVNYLNRIIFRFIFSNFPIAQVFTYSPTYFYFNS